jgi:hypothetical protein
MDEKTHAPVRTLGDNLQNPLINITLYFVLSTLVDYKFQRKEEIINK